MGVWSGSAAQCLAITCSALPAPTNGQIIYGPDTTAPYNSQTMATYRCDPGFGLSSGDRVRTCVASAAGPGEWSGTASSCGTITCSILSPPTNGLLTYSSTPPYVVGVSATYSCNEGYALSSRVTRTCGGDGSSTSGVWSAAPATCIAITCPELTSPSNGMIIFSPDLTAPYSYGTTATYGCTNGFGLSSGDVTRICGGDGTSSMGVWSGTNANCGAITCPELSQITNGATVYAPDTFSPYNFGTVATHTCNEGYYRVGSSAQTCGGDGSSVNGMWSGSTPVCAAVMCPLLTIPENGAITYSETSFPSVGFMETATYSCNTGYGLSGGDRVRTCIGPAGSSGEWSGSAPTCQAINCPALGAPSNGQVSFSLDTTPPHVFGTEATFTCNTGFGLSGDTSRMCGGDGSSPSGAWSGSSPSCIAYTCNSLPSISNGEISYSPDTTSPFDYGTVAMYSCVNGYSLSETAVRTCSGSMLQGYWLGTEPECLVIACTMLATPTNGQITYGPDTTAPYDYQTTATYSCNEGYGLFGGDSSRQCVSASPGDGGWSGTAPTCEVITCSSLTTPTNGRIAYSAMAPYTSGTMATFSCNDGYGISGGDQMLTCGGDGSSPNGLWSGMTPTCEAITCSALTVPSNGIITYPPFSSSPYAFGVVATVSCMTGFGLNGGDVMRSCDGDGSSQNGMWTGMAPTCEAITCTSLTAISNGVIAYSPDTVSPFNYATMATYTCNEGFFLQGSSARTCVGDGSSVDGVWSGSAPVCAAVMCPGLDDPANGMIVYSEDASPTVGFMETATYSCTIGYGLSGGDRVRTCVGSAGSSGEWSGSAPTCQAITCPSLSSLPNGQVVYSAGATSPYSYGTTATFVCNTGYGLNGDSSTTCVGDGSSTNGVWTGMMPTCNPYVCTTLPSIPNGEIIYDPDITSPFSFGTTASYSCNEGFYLSDDSLRICTGTGATGFWDGTEPECLPIVCSSLPPPSDGFISYGPDTTSPFNYQTSATYICNEGYGLFGGGTSRVCVGSNDGVGQWTGATPRCESITCSFRFPPDNGDLTFSRESPYTYGTVITYTCDEGYGLIGDGAMAVCRGDGSSPFGEWDSMEPTCEVITCLPLEPIDNGVITYSQDTTSSFNYGTSATHTCEQGFGLVGAAERVCGGDGSSVDGTWSGFIPICAEFRCPALNVPENGAIMYIENAQGFVEKANYSCEDEYVLIGGDSVRTCVPTGATVGISGEWTGSAPICQANPNITPGDTSELVAPVAGATVGAVVVVVVIVVLVIAVIVAVLRLKRKDKDELDEPVIFHQDPEGEGHDVVQIDNPIYMEDDHKRHYENIGPLLESAQQPEKDMFGDEPQYFTAIDDDVPLYEHQGINNNDIYDS